ncbi:hypothetical protein ACFL26_01795 [Patescibacteria group bacterium]
MAEAAREGWVKSNLARPATCPTCARNADPGDSEGCFCSIEGCENHVSDDEVLCGRHALIKGVCRCCGRPFPRPEKKKSRGSRRGHARDKNGIRILK